jgi:hypothetical protein
MLGVRQYVVVVVQMSHDVAKNDMFQDLTGD